MKKKKRYGKNRKKDEKLNCKLRFYRSGQSRLEKYFHKFLNHWKFYPFGRDFQCVCVCVDARVSLALDFDRKFEFEDIISLKSHLR